MPNWLDELAGVDDDLGDVGFPFPFRRRKRNKRIAMRRLIPAVPGAPAHGWAMQPLPMTTVTFTSTSGTSLTSTGRPQKGFKARRLFVDLTRTGASATGLVTVTAINFGVVNVLVGVGNLSVAMFQNLAVDAGISFPPIAAGLDINVGLSISAAPTTTDTVACSISFLGETIG
jgi:hypothetical protein